MSRMAWVYTSTSKAQACEHRTSEVQSRWKGVQNSFNHREGSLLVKVFRIMGTSQWKSAKQDTRDLESEGLTFSSMLEAPVTKSKSLKFVPM